MPSETIIAWTNAEATRRAIVERCPSGQFRFCEEHFVTLDETEHGGGIYDYWTPRHRSGLYPSALDAQNDAALTLPWLRVLLNEIAKRPH